MRRGVALYLVGSAVLLSLAGCGRGWLSFEEREPWRREAELACIKSGAVKPSPVVVQIKSIEGPGICGADFPYKVAALGEGSALGFADSLRPPGSIPGGFPRTPPPARAAAPAPYSAPYSAPYPAPNSAPYPAERAAYPAQDQGPMSLRPPGAEPEPEEDEEPEPPDGDPYAVPGAKPLTPAPYGRSAQPDVYPRGRAAPGPAPYPASPYPPQNASPLPRLGPQRDALTPMTTASVKPAATLACPMVSALDRWFAEAVQPAAQRWFGQPVVEVKQISAYSCRGMNGQRGAPISEHAFGNALDVAAFTLADGRVVTVKNGWRGEPEEQGFLHDVQASACQQFSTVLAPGSNVYHYDHIHVDLARRRSGRSICKPAAVSGDLVAQRAREHRYSGRAGGRLGFAPDDKAAVDFEIKLPRAVPGAD